MVEAARLGGTCVDEQIDMRPERSLDFVRIGRAGSPLGSHLWRSAGVPPRRNRPRHAVIRHAHADAGPFAGDVLCEPGRPADEASATGPDPSQAGGDGR